MINSLISATAVFIICSSTVVAFTQVNRSVENNRTITVRSPEHSFSLVIPKGWVAEQSENVPDGFLAFSYQGGGTGKTPSVALLATIYIGDDNNIPFNQRIMEDVSEFKTGHPANQVLNGGALITAKKKKAVVKYFIGDSGETNEAVAYIDEGKVIVLLILSARTKEQLYGAIPVFRRFIRSYNSSE